MKPQPGFTRLHPVFRRAVSCFLAAIIVSAMTAAAAVPKKSTRSKAVATVRSILKRNTAACKIDEVRSIAAARVRYGWRVTAKLVMSASGSPTNETAVWTVRSSDGKAVPNNQLTAEISKGCS